MEDSVKEKATGVFNQIVTLENVLLVIGIYIIVLLVSRMFPKIVHSEKSDKFRLLSILPVLFGIIGKAIPGMHEKGAPWSIIILTGLFCGFTSTQLHSILKRWVPSAKFDDISTPEDESKVIPIINPPPSEPKV